MEYKRTRTAPGKDIMSKEREAEGVIIKPFLSPSSPKCPLSPPPSLPAGRFSTLLDPTYTPASVYHPIVYEGVPPVAAAEREPELLP